MSESVSKVGTLPVARESRAAAVAVALILGAALYPFAVWLGRTLADQVTGHITTLLIGLEAYVRSLAGVPL